MNEAYQDPNHVASFGGVDGLYRAAQGKVPKKEIQNWLQSANACPVQHKPVPTNRVIVYAIDRQEQADLVDLIINGSRKSREVGEGKISLCRCFSDQSHKHLKEENCTPENSNKNQDTKELLLSP
ncbi:hypothetical protein AVEN_106091-1 [Araneus ventricosus]|uniref:Uncharacterized protein n=1 Tax=Araneus ventricosus TaxID=182803 RepID=A0A4Y2HTG6_ARAVE|nr:hypothetical protein AVEN_106091-1 [Araneus ventricosus]